MSVPGDAPVPPWRSQIIDGSLDLQRQRVELVGIWLMAAGEARKSAQLAGETESAPMEDQQLQLLPPGLPEQHAHHLVRLVEGRHGQLVTDDGLQGRRAVDRIRHLLHPALGHADNVDARTPGRGRRQVHIIHGELQHRLVDEILDGPGQGPRHLGIGDGGLVDLDLLIKAGREGHPHLRLGQTVPGKQLGQGLGPVVGAVDRLAGKHGNGVHAGQQNAIAGQQDPDLMAGGRNGNGVHAGQQNAIAGQQDPDLMAGGRTPEQWLHLDLHLAA